MLCKLYLTSSVAKLWMWIVSQLDIYNHVYGENTLSHLHSTASVSVQRRRVITDQPLIVILPS